MILIKSTLQIGVLSFSLKFAWGIAYVKGKKLINKYRKLIMPSFKFPWKSIFWTSSIINMLN